MAFLGRKNKKFNRDKKYGLRRFKRSFLNSINGVKISYEDEQSLWIHLVMSIVVIICGIIFRINRYEWVFSIILMGMILCAELLNTAIEASVDLTTDRIHPLAKRAKDVGSATTFMMSVLAFIGEMIIFIPHMIEFFR